MDSPYVPGSPRKRDSKRSRKSALVTLLPVTACIAAAAPVAWSEAGRPEEAIRRAIGSPEARVRRQRALQGVIIALVGSSLGAGLGAVAGLVVHRIVHH